MVDIHRKPGYDPCELFLNPEISSPKLKIALKLLKKKLGFRTLMDVVPLDAGLVKGSHGRVEIPEKFKPVMITRRTMDDATDEIPCRQIRDVILDHLFA
jgi:hypothetical protein